MVFDLLKSKSNDWNKIARELMPGDGGFRYRIELERSNCEDENKLEKVIYKWIERQSTPVTWNTLCQLFEKLQYCDLLTELGNKSVLLSFELSLLF